MGTQAAPMGELVGELQVREEVLPVQVLTAGQHTLVVRFPGQDVPENRAEFNALRLRCQARELELGRCRYLAHAPGPARRLDDVPLQGHGKIVFLDQVYDFSALPRTGMVFELERRMEQLPVLWGRKKEIRPAFREYIAETVYDLQVYRGVLDEIDRNLADESPEVRAELHQVVARSEYPKFRALFDRQLEELAWQVRDFSKEEHERHGFYLRKHAWDLIRASEFLLRTNLKPRGYAGDSQMMRMVYEDAFRGQTLFSRFMHRHPLQTEAAQAVRNRVGLIAARLSRLRDDRGAADPLRLMSVASGPAWELRELFKAPEDVECLEVTLLDQDAHAHIEARALVGELEGELGGRLRARYIRDSVRTMIRSRRLADDYGRFGFIYTMGLFDYLTAPVAKVVLRKLYQLLQPGGELVVGNFHVGNKTRTYMEYWMDWVLLHRTERELLELASDLAGARASIQFEDTGSQVFLCVRKSA